MLRIHQAIQAGKFPNASKLARELEVSTKSIHRDIEFMRDRLDLPIEYDGSRFGYRYTEEVNAFPTVQITEIALDAVHAPVAALTWVDERTLMVANHCSPFAWRMIHKCGLVGGAAGATAWTLPRRH